MAEDRPDEPPVVERAEQEAIVQSFEIRGLYGYRDISLSSRYAATVLIAKNGTGKTTLLGALAAFLSRQFSRLKDLNFKEIRCRLRGVDNEIILTKEDILALLEIPTDAEFIKYSRRGDIDPTSLFIYIMEEWSQAKSADWRNQHDNKNFSAIFRAHNYNFIETRAWFDRTRKELLQRSPAASAAADAIEAALGAAEVVYLPTYRRIEISLQPDKAEPRRRPKLDVSSSLFTGDIQFGLADISERLAQLNQSILIDSNSGYREISANIINELVDGSFEAGLHAERPIPSRDELNLFFSRLEEGRRVGPYFDHVSIPNIDKIYTKDGITASSTVFLNYFLSKLGTVIAATHDVELKVQEFITMCNSYLSSDDESTKLSRPGEHASYVDGKELYLNRRNLNVHVQTVPGGRRVGLDALSSGEKQMISLFGKLYLYPGDKIVLIDEPELSLSIDWQRRILVDVLNTANCRQVIAITHSPFVFDNELEPYARSLKIRIDPSAPSSGPDAALNGEELDG